MHLNEIESIINEMKQETLEREEEQKQVLEETDIAVFRYADLLNTVRLMFSDQLLIDEQITANKSTGTIFLRSIALYAELGEMLNEYNEFKFWHANPVKNVAAWKEEHIDILAVSLSMGNMMAEDLQKNDEPVLKEQFMEELLRDVAYTLYITEEKAGYDGLIVLAASIGSEYLSNWIALAVYPFINNVEELKELYKAKSNINYERANNKDY